MGTWSDHPLTKPKEVTLNTLSRVFPDVIAAVVIVAASALATKQLGNVVSGQDLLALYGLVMGYVFGKNVSAAPSA